jgi:MFS family permease
MAIQTIRKILTRDFILVFFAQFVLAFVTHILTPTLPIYLSRLGSTTVEIGFLIGIFSVSSLVFRPLIGRALIKISEKKFMIAGALLSTLSSVAYLLAPPLLASFYGKGLSRDWLRILQYRLLHIDYQYQPRGPSGTKSQLLLTGPQCRFSPGSFLRNVPDQPL